MRGMVAKSRPAGALVDFTKDRAELARPHPEHPGIALEAGDTRAIDAGNAGNDPEVPGSRQGNQLEDHTKCRRLADAAEHEFAELACRPLKSQRLRKTASAFRVSMPGKDRDGRAADGLRSRVSNRGGSGRTGLFHRAEQTACEKKNESEAAGNR